SSVCSTKQQLQRGWRTDTDSFERKAEVAKVKVHEGCYSHGISRGIDGIRRLNIYQFLDTRKIPVQISPGLDFLAQLQPFLARSYFPGDTFRRCRVGNYMRALGMDFASVGSLLGGKRSCGLFGIVHVCGNTPIAFPSKTNCLQS